MNFRIGQPPEAQMDTDQAWQLVKEPSPMSFQISALFTALSLFILIAVIVALSVGPNRIFDWSYPALIVFIFLIIPFHEIVHAIGFKGGAFSRQVVFGFYPKGFGFYTYYNGEMTRGRYITIALLPFLMISTLPLALLAFMKLDWKYLTEIILANGLASSTDIFSVIIILKVTPRQSVLINSGMKTYWKPKG